MTAIHPCRTCGARLEFELIMAGQTIACPECQALVTLPELPPAPIATPAPPQIPPPTANPPSTLSPNPAAPRAPSSSGDILVPVMILLGFAVPGCLLLSFLSIPILGGVFSLLFLIGAVLAGVLFIITLGFYAVAKSSSRQ